MMLSVEGLTVRYGEKTVLDGVSFSADEGDWLMIAGPNGAGKSTVVNAVSRGVPYTGRIQLGGRDIAHLRPAALARQVGVLTQSHSLSYAFTVEEIVRMGRYSRSRSLFSREGDDGGEEAVEQALRLTGLAKLRRRSALTLSGGEVQRMFLAQLLAQEPSLLLLDEPTNHLDLVYQKQLFALLREWLARPGRAVVSVVHDLSLARAFGTKALLLDRGRAVACGETASVLSSENLDRVYDMDVSAWMRLLLEQWSA